MHRRHACRSAGPKWSRNLSSADSGETLNEGGDMSRAMAGGIDTAYSVQGQGYPLLMFAPGGFGAVRSNWSGLGVYRRLGLIENLSQHFTCITFDRREAGESGGRLERVTWDHYVAQGLGLLDHLGIERAAVVGGCIGSSIAARTAVTAPDRIDAMVLYSPAGGVHYRLGQHERFRTHLSFVAEVGLAGVVDLATTTDAGFSKDPRLGPWVSVIRRDPTFASAYREWDLERYVAMATGMVRLQFDRDSVPGVEPEDLLGSATPALVVPGDDASHATSAAHFLAECLPNGGLWDVPVDAQTESNAPERIQEFLQRVVSTGG